MKLLFQEDFRRLSVSMYLEVQKGDVTYIIGQKDGVLVQQELDPIQAEDEPLMPLLTMSAGLANDFVKAVCDFASKKGIKTENENLLQGKLMATEKHLEDLRSHFTKVLDKALT